MSLFFFPRPPPSFLLTLNPCCFVVKGGADDGTSRCVSTPKTSPVQQNKHPASMWGVGLWFPSSPGDAVWSLLWTFSLTIAPSPRVAPRRVQSRVIGRGEWTPWPKQQRGCRFTVRSVTATGPQRRRSRLRSKPLQVSIQRFLPNGTPTGPCAYQTHFRTERAPRPR